MKASPEAITATLDLWYKGLSLNKIVDHLDQFYGIRTRASTLYGWIKKYTIAMKRYTRKLKLSVAKKWHADETTLGVRGRAYHMWTTLDHRTRFAIATRLSRRRRSAEADRLLQESRKRVLRSPDKIVTDGLSSYVAPISSMNDGSTGAPQHVRGLSFRNDGNNNRIERFNGTVKERVKVMRGLHNPQAAAVFADGFADYYNFIRPNLALGGRTPAEKAGVVRLQGNRWMALIRHSSRHHRRMHHQEGRKTA
jgi:transposase-like protein